MVGKPDTTDSSIKEYGRKIEKFLMKKKGNFCSELQIAEEIFHIRFGKGANIPRLEKQMQKLSDIRKALKLLMAQGRVKGSLLEDSRTKENVMHYSIIE